MTAASQADWKRRILVYYDGSAESTRAVDRVVEIASVVRSDVTVVSAEETPVAVRGAGRRRRRRG
jgi:nucleotide-binding universal stress UspA family protein